MSVIRSHITLFLLASALAFSACAPQRMVAPEYAARGFEGKTLVVAPLDRLPVIGNPEDLVGGMGSGSDAEVYRSFFFSVLPDSLRSVSTFSLVLSETHYYEKPELSVRSLPLSNGEPLRFELPAPGTTVRFETVIPHAILFVRHLRVSRTGGAGTTIRPDGMLAGGSSPTLRHEANYAYWDNLDGRVISYGTVTVDTVFLTEIGLDTWRKALGEVARELVIGSPMARPD